MPPPSAADIAAARPEAIADTAAPANVASACHANTLRIGREASVANGPARRPVGRSGAGDGGGDAFTSCPAEPCAMNDPRQANLWILS
jgi:hypothetical protein